jgi:hypothetical protein
MLLHIDSFLTEDERLELLCTAYSASSSDWSIQNGGGEYWVGNRFPFQSPIFDLLNERIKLYFDDYDFISPFCGIQRISQGGGMGEHTDNYQKTCRFGCVVYLNDNFEGGDLVYPRLNTVWRPSASQLVVHAGDEPHLVSTVSSGTRYMLTCFVYGSETKNPSVNYELQHQN